MIKTGVNSLRDFLGYLIGEGGNFMATANAGKIQRELGKGAKEITISKTPAGMVRDKGPEILYQKSAVVWKREPDAMPDGTRVGLSTSIAISRRCAGVKGPFTYRAEYGKKLSEKNVCQIKLRIPEAEKEIGPRKPVRIKAIEELVPAELIRAAEDKIRRIFPPA